METNVIKPFEEREPYRPDLKATSAPKGKKTEAIEKEMEDLLIETDKLKQAITDAVSNVVDKSDEEATDVMNEVFEILSIITSIIQKLARTQAKDLFDLTKLANIYTKMQGEVKIYSKNNYPPDIEWGKDDEKTIHDKIQNANQNQQIVIERIRNLKDMVVEDMKKLQSLINTTDDAQKGMLDFMQTFIQKLREWLASITTMGR